MIFYLILESYYAISGKRFQRLLKTLSVTYQDQLPIMAPTLEENICSRNKHQEDTDAPNQTRDKGALISNSPDLVSVARKDKDAVFLIEQIFKNGKRQYSSLGRDGERPLKMTKEILNQVGDDLGIQEPEGP